MAVMIGTGEVPGLCGSDERLHRLDETAGEPVERRVVRNVLGLQIAEPSRVLLRGRYTAVEVNIVIAPCWALGRDLHRVSAIGSNASVIPLLAVTV